MKNLLATAALGLTLAAAAPASAAPFTFDFTGANTVSGNGRVFTATSGNQTLKVTATAWSTDGITLKDAYLGVYGGDTGGLGVTADNETGAFNTHTIDNNNGADFVMLQFDQAVTLTGMDLNVYSVNFGTKDSDVTLGWGGTATNMGALALNNAAFATLTNMMTLNSKDYGAKGASGNDGWRNVALANATGTTWLVGASFVNPDAYTDGFKLAGLKVESVVPEPATWAMMLVGFGMIGAASRYQRRRTRVAIA